MASAHTFDPSVACCWAAGACLCLAPRQLLGLGSLGALSTLGGLHESGLTGLGGALWASEATHVCTTPALVAAMSAEGWTRAKLPRLLVLALGGEKMPLSLIQAWGRPPGEERIQEHGHGCRVQSDITGEVDTENK